MTIFYKKKWKSTLGSLMTTLVATDTWQKPNNTGSSNSIPILHPLMLKKIGIEKANDEVCCPSVFYSCLINFCEKNNPTIEIICVHSYLLKHFLHRDSCYSYLPPVSS